MSKLMQPTPSARPSPASTGKRTFIRSRMPAAADALARSKVIASLRSMTSRSCSVTMSA